MPRKEQARIDLALRRDVAVADHARRRDAVARDDVLREPDQRIDLLRRVRLPAAVLRIERPAVHVLDADRHRIEARSCLPR
jgi:hypothetical protein